MPFNEDTRVKSPALLHLMRLGYAYVYAAEHKNRILENNIFKEIFLKQMVKITQFMVFSNHEEYQGGVIDPVYGAFYASPSYGHVQFNYFREDPDESVFQKLKTV